MLAIHFIISYFILSALFVVIAFLFDIYRYTSSKRKFMSEYGQYIGKSFRVIDQSDELGSILENNILVHDVYYERGIYTHSFQPGDLVTVLPYPKIKFFRTISIPFTKKTT